MDGARIFNAAVSSGIPAAELVASCDTVTFCLSKGLGAPVGSVLCGRKEVIARARELRKQLGGAMRQAGYLAAAGLEALAEASIERLAEDHRNAETLVRRLSTIEGLSVRSHTNIIQVTLKNHLASDAAGFLAERGVLVRVTAARELRMLTHRGISARQVNDAADIITGCLEPVVRTPH